MSESENPAYQAIQKTLDAIKAYEEKPPVNRQESHHSAVIVWDNFLEAARGPLVQGRNRVSHAASGRDYSTMVTVDYIAAHAATYMIWRDQIKATAFGTQTPIVLREVEKIDQTVREYMINDLIEGAALAKRTFTPPIRRL